MKNFFFIAFALAGALIVGCSEKKDDSVIAQCGTCHSLPPANGFHTTHARYGKCSICHQGYEKNTAVNATTHQNGKVNVSFSLLFNPEDMGAYNPTTGACTNVYCHGAFPQGTNASIATSSSISIGKNCQICHDTGSMMVNHYTFNEENDTISNCGKCHPGYGKVNGAMAGRFVNDSLHVNGKIDTLPR